MQCRPPDRPRARAGGGRPPTRVTDNSVQNNTGPIGGPVISYYWKTKSNTTKAKIHP